MYKTSETIHTCQVSGIIKTILGGLYFERNIEEELYSFPSGSTYSLDVLERTLMKVGEMHGEHSRKGIYSRRLCQMSKMLKPDVDVCCLRCNFGSVLTVHTISGILLTKI